MRHAIIGQGPRPPQAPQGPRPPTEAEQFLNNIPPWYRALSAVGTAAGAYHGYKRNDSIGWAIGWAILGGAFPFITLPIALAQGFGEQAKGGAR